MQTVPYSPLKLLKNSLAEQRFTELQKELRKILPEPAANYISNLIVTDNFRGSAQHYNTQRAYSICARFGEDKDIILSIHKSREKAEVMLSQLKTIYPFLRLSRQRCFVLKSKRRPSVFSPFPAQNIFDG